MKVRAVLIAAAVVTAVQLPPAHAQVRIEIGRGWTGIKNGELLRRMIGHYDVLITSLNNGRPLPRRIGQTTS